MLFFVATLLSLRYQKIIQFSVVWFAVRTYTIESKWIKVRYRKLIILTQIHRFCLIRYVLMYTFLPFCRVNRLLLFFFLDNHKNTDEIRNRKDEKKTVFGFSFSVSCTCFSFLYVNDANKRAQSLTHILFITKSSECEC